MIVDALTSKRNRSNFIHLEVAVFFQKRLRLISLIVAENL